MKCKIPFAQQRSIIELKKSKIGKQRNIKLLAAPHAATPMMIVRHIDVLVARLALGKHSPHIDRGSICLVLVSRI